MNPIIYAPNASSDILEMFREHTIENVKNGIKYLDGETVQWGWSWFLVNESESGLELTAPVFGKMPMEFDSDLSESLNILIKQRYICDSFEVEMEVCDARQSAIVAVDICDCSEIFINRINEQEDEASGWFVGAQDSKANPDNSDDYELKSLWELSCLFPRITEFLLLPVNMQVVFGEKTIMLNNFEPLSPIKDSYFESKF